MIKYHNASDTSGTIITIDKVTPENRASMQFLCLGCGEEMEAVLGKEREHHFRHKDKGNCNPETYLHRLNPKKTNINSFYLSFLLFSQTPQNVVDRVIIVSNLKFKEVRPFT